MQRFQKRRMGHQALLGAVDQLTMAVANFLLGVVVARMSGVQGLGEFSFAYAVLVLANLLHTAAVGEVFSLREEHRDWLKGQGVALLLIAASSVGLIVCALVPPILAIWPEQARSLASPGFFAALATSAIYWSTKPYFHRLQRPASTLLATLLYAGVTLAVAYVGYRGLGERMQPLWAIAAGSVAASIPLLARLRWPRAGFRSELEAYVRATAKHVAWSVPAAVLIWINSNGFAFLANVQAGAEQAGGLRAVNNLIAPVNTMLVGACGAVLPWLAQHSKVAEPLRFRRIVHAAAAAIAIVSLVFALCLFPLSERALAQVYGDGFSPFAGALRVALLLPALWAASSVYRVVIRASADGRTLFKAYAIALIPVGVTVMWVCTQHAAEQMVWGQLGVQALVLIAFVLLFSPARRSSAS